MANRAILWDFDGTLGFRPGMWSQAVVDAVHAANLGITCTRDDVRPYLRDGFPWHRADRPHPHLTSPSQWWAEVEQILAQACAAVGCTAPQAERLAREAHALYVGPEGWIAYEDAIPTLSHLQATGWRHIILSNHVPELPAIVEYLGLAPFIAAVFTSAATGYEKPHPNAYRCAIEWLSSPSVVWMVGDSVEVDVLGAEAVGIPAILVRGTDARASRCSADLAGVICALSES